jgi:hypothetical protein
MQQLIAARDPAVPGRGLGGVKAEAGLAGFAAILAMSLAFRRNGATPDVAWLTDMCLRMLAGERGWVDIFETTPPVPTLLYLPGAWLAAAFGVEPQLAQFLIAYAVGVAGIFAARRILLSALPRRSVDLSFTAPAGAAFFILATDAFAQREWYAAVFSLPIAAVFIVRAESGAWPARAARVAAALLAGLSFAIKPPLFALPFLALAGVELLRSRRLDFLFPSMLPVAAISGVLLTAASLAAFPDYLRDLGPLMREVYVPSRLPIAEGFTVVFIAVAPMTILAIAAARARRAPGAAIFAVLAAAHAALYFAQGKYFPYHLQPAAAFVILSLAASAAAYGLRQAPAIAAALAVGSLGIAVGLDDGRPARGARAWAAGLERPTMMAISPYISTGFPLALDVGGVWIDRIHSQWVVNYARHGADRKGLDAGRRAAFDRWRRAEIARTIRLVRDRRPDVILLFGGNTWLVEEFLAADPSLFDAYDRVAVEGATIVLRRRDLARHESTFRLFRVGNVL